MSLAAAWLLCNTTESFILLRLASTWQVPAEFSGLNALAWFSLAGNPACRPAPPIRPDILPLTLSQLELATALGDGASGDVFAARFQERDVAIKIFKSESSPDGHARDEIAVTCFVDHPNLIKVIGVIDHPHALVLERVWGVPLALKPNFESLLRCRWTSEQTFSAAFVLHVAKSVANALAYLHGHNICHGDVYAHNVLADKEGHSVLCDYGELGLCFCMIHKRQCTLQDVVKTVPCGDSLFRLCASIRESPVYAP